MFWFGRSKILQIVFLFFFSIAFSQVGINTSTPAEDAMLDIETTDKGLLIPRVSISDLTTIAPVNSVSGGNSESLLVYNTNEDLANGITKGFYYWNGTEWVGLDGRNSNDWSIEGNTGTDPDDATRPNFLGTIDDQDFAIRTNDAERVRIDNNGFVGINTAPSDYRLSVNADGSERGVLSITDEGFALAGAATSTDDSVQKIGIIGVAGGNVFRVPGNGSDVAIAGSSRDYGLYMTVDGAGGTANKIGGIFNLDNNTNTADGVGLAIAQLAGSFVGNTTVYGGLFNSQDFGVYAIGGSEAAVYAEGDLTVTENVQFEDYGDGDNIGIPAYTLGVDANGNLLEFVPTGSLGNNDSVKYSNSALSTGTNLNTMSTVSVPLFGTANWNDNATLYIQNALNETEMTITQAGRYQVVINLSVELQTAELRPNLDMQIRINGNAVGSISSTGYIRNTGGHDHSSLHLNETLELQANDVLTVGVIREANSGTVVMRSTGTSNITITKLR